MNKKISFRTFSKYCKHRFPDDHGRQLKHDLCGHDGTTYGHSLGTNPLGDKQQYGGHYCKCSICPVFKQLRNI